VWIHCLAGDPVKHGLNDKQRMFCHEYMVDMNATQAAARAGYSKKTANQIGARLLAHVGVQDYLQSLQIERGTRLNLKADDVLLELLRLAKTDLRKAYGPDGNLLPVHEIPEDIARAISGIEIEKVFDYEGGHKVQTGTVQKVKFWDKVKSLELLGKHLKLWVEQIEITGLEGLGLKLQEARARATKR
jgi:phage terminase small subunit